MISELTTKILKLMSTCEHDPYGDDYGHDIKVEEMSIEGFLNGLTPQELAYYGLVRIDPQKGLTKEAIDALKQQGWVHPSTIKSQNERKELEQKFWMMFPDSDYWNRFEQLDIENIPDHQIEKLVDLDGEVLQKVSIKSIFPEKEYKKYLAAKKRKEEKKQKKKLSAEKKKAKQKAKEIAQAKQLLIEAGELTPEKE